MLDLIAENPVLRLLLLALLFASVAVVAYFVAQVINARQLTRRRLLEEGPRVGGGTPLAGSLRSERAESAWLKLVNSIEKSGLSLVDSKDEALRQRLASAGFTASYAPRMYTLIRLVLVIGLPIIVFALFWTTGSSPRASRRCAVAAPTAFRDDPGVPLRHLYLDAPREPQAILDALARGAFYATTGVMLDRAEVDRGELVVAIAPSDPANKLGPSARDKIVFVENGKRIEVAGKTASRALPASGYVRAVIERDDGARAWTQPARR